MPRMMAQERASHALGKIKALIEPTKKDYGKYRSYVSALPANILNNGLGHAMAQLLAQADPQKGADDPHRMLHDHVQDWVCNHAKVFSIEGGHDEVDLLIGIINGDQKTYLRTQAEVLAYLEWLKKFARAMLEKPKEQ